MNDSFRLFSIVIDGILNLFHIVLNIFCQFSFQCRRSLHQFVIEFPILTLLQDLNQSIVVIPHLICNHREYFDQRSCLQYSKFFQFVNHWRPKRLKRSQMRINNRILREFIDLSIGICYLVIVFFDFLLFLHTDVFL